METALVLVRLAQYAGAAILFGSSLFFLHALPRDGPVSAAELGWPRRLLLGGAALMLAGGLVGLVVQTATMAGSLSEALKPASLQFMVSGTGIGRAAVARAAVGALAVLALVTQRPGRGLWAVVCGLGAAGGVSLAWMGHGAATEGPGGTVHLVSDIFHSLAAAVWVGALTAFFILLWPHQPAAPERSRALHAALRGFSGLGSILVATLVTTGLVNSWFLVGIDRLGGLWTTDYGRLLLAKLLLFAFMLALAAANRFRLTPALQASLNGDLPPEEALARLKSSVVLETGSGFAILVLVAWLGTLAPVSAQ